ncbi:hypothetical protein [Dongia sp. agr-C8]
MHINIPRLPVTRLLGLTLFWISGGLLLSASSCIVPEPQRVPGEQLTWAEQHALDQQEYQTMHENRRQDRPCKKNGCP